MLDLDAWVERAAIMEFDGGLSRFKAETLAAEAQGTTRWKAVEAMGDAERKRNSEGSRGRGQALDGQQRSVPVPGVQPNASEKDGPLPERDEDAGRGGLALLALRAQRRGVL
ncbi:hypothetical protein Q4543_17690 [Salipiger sp. 1_MG-2023]|uniref:hypothetical protein n=1 Tax=Salipiger sp. 1_MG-2023 TaxID=3062665 RepID=UPI0026E29B7D|nr:hypothetical protein [Salipiger sp. 1_MG-2023]MDO6587348.1 hypothetical protein [Salipiger sp. 1_MG-2023]